MLSNIKFPILTVYRTLVKNALFAVACSLKRASILITLLSSSARWINKD